MGIKKVGDWKKALMMTNELGTIFEQAKQQSLMQVGLYAEGRAKSHISDQDLPWPALAPSTVVRKLRLGYSNKIYVETSTYFSSITSYVKNDRAYAGVKKTVKYGTGMYVGDIARTLEFGNTKMPARPLWAPVMKATIPWWRKNADPARIAVRMIKQKYR